MSSYKNLIFNVRVKYTTFRNTSVQITEVDIYIVTCTDMIIFNHLTYIWAAVIVHCMAIEDLFGGGGCMRYFLS